MKRIFAGLTAALFAVNSFAATLNPVQLLNPIGSTSGQAVVSTGPTTAPGWGNVSAVALTGIVPVLNGGTGVTTAAAELSRIGAAPLASASPTGTWAFAARPTFASNTPYDTGNLTIANYLTTATAASTYAPIASPTLTGTPLAPTASAATNNTQLATTAYVTTAVANFGANRNQPYFQAYLSANQSFTAGTPTKIAFNTKNFDSGTYYDAVTNFRYTPLVAGKYLVTVQLTAQGVSSAVNQYAPVAAFIYKNGVQVVGSSMQLYFFSSGLTLGQSANITATVAMNGTTDYVEGWGNVSTVGSTLFNGGSTLTFIQAVYLGP